MTPSLTSAICPDCPNVAEINWDVVEFLVSALHGNEDQCKRENLKVLNFKSQVWYCKTLISILCLKMKVWA